MARPMGRRLFLVAARLLLVAALLALPVLWSAGASAAAVEVPVGVVLDLARDAGRKSLVASISMALDDFYVRHQSYATRVGLHVRDSRGDLGTAAHAAEDLIKNVQVQAIIVAPQTSAEADLFVQLGSHNNILVLSLFGIPPALPLYTVPFFVHTTPKGSSPVAPIAGIVSSFAGHEVIMVCEDSLYGTGILQALTDALQSNKVHAADSVVVPIGVANEIQARLFIMRPEVAINLFSRAEDAGMMSEGYLWIATVALGNVGDSLNSDHFAYMQGLVILRPCVRTRRYVSNFSSRLKARFHLDTDDVENPSMLMFWAYDTAWATAMAAEIAALTRSTIWMAEKDLGQRGVFATKRAFLDSFLNIDFDVLTREFKLVIRKWQLQSYKILTVIAKGAMAVCLWTPLSSLSQNLSTKRSSFKDSTSDSGTFEPVFRQDDTVSVLASEGREKIGFKLETKPSLNPKTQRNARKLVERDSGKMCSAYTKKALKIGVPLTYGLKVFVNASYPYFFCKDNVTRPSTAKQKVTGYSIEVFEAAIQKLQHPPCYEFCVFDGSYDELVGNVSIGNLDGAVGDVTITAERARLVDFTIPYTQSGVSLLVLCGSDLEPIQWTFLEPLTKELWFATLGFFFTGFVVWMIERPRNPEYQGSSLRQFSTASYFAFSTLTFSHDHTIRSPLSKIVAVVWCLVVVVLVQSYTASLSSMLTEEKLQPLVTDLNQLLVNGAYVGYPDRSFVHSILISEGFSEDSLRPYSTGEEYAKALRNGRVSAVIDEIPYLTPLLSDPRYQIVSHIYKTPGFGFAFPRGSTLSCNLSTAILNLTEGVEGLKIENKWLGSADASQTVSRRPSTPLTLQNFSGLFLTSGFISSLMLLISIVRLAHARWIAASDSNAESTENTVGGEESHPLQNGTENYSALDQSHPEARSDNYQGIHESRRSGGDEGSRPVQNDMDSNFVHGPLLHEAISNDAQGADRSSRRAGHEELNPVQNDVSDGFVRAQSFQIEINTT